MHVQELARRLGATVDPGVDLEIDGVGPIEDAAPGQLTFLSNAKYAPRIQDTQASAVLVAPDFQGESPAALLRIANPYLAFAKAISLLYSPPALPPGVHPTAVLGERVILGRDVAIGAYAVLGDDVVVGDGTTIHPHCVVYAGARIGAHCLLHSHAVVREHVRIGDRNILQNGAVIGADGFGFAPRGDGSWLKIPQAGTVELGDDVEVQSLACVDRATVGTTRVGRGTKIDNLVQVGHGSQVGADAMLCGQVGLAGSTHIEDRVTLAGQVGVAGHLTIGAGSTVTAQAGVTSDLAPGAVYGGAPAVPFKDLREVLFHYMRLPELAKRVKALERAQGGKAPAGDAPPSR